MTATVIESFALGPQWPTIDPFLFVAHHKDAYPAANGKLGPPQASLAGRPLGNDFGLIDGWNMYHGRSVPGFPQHPHRGFETISYVRSGFMDHADSLGATARFGAGDVQWMTAGAGIVHSEMFPLLNDDAPNPLEMFQIWLNLPAKSKMVAPYFSMRWNGQMPTVDADNAALTVIVGRYELDSVGTAAAPTAPPDSWANDPSAEVAIWHIQLAADGRVELPATDQANRVVYVFGSNDVSYHDEPIAAGKGAVVKTDTPVVVSASQPTELLVLQGRPIGEPVAQYGPFVMNTNKELEETFVDYNRTRFGGWPWPNEEPNHGAEPKRFAIHADGRHENAP